MFHPEGPDEWIITSPPALHMTLARQLKSATTVDCLASSWERPKYDKLPFGHTDDMIALASHWEDRLRAPKGEKINHKFGLHFFPT